MKKKSMLIIITPDSNSFGRKIFSKYWSGYHAPRHKTIFNEDSLQLFISKNKKITYSSYKIYDPFTNILSLRNFIKQISFKRILHDMFHVIFFFFYIFSDLLKKNRILLKIDKL